MQDLVSRRAPVSRLRKDLATLDRAAKRAVGRNPMSAIPAIAKAQRTLNRAFVELEQAARGDLEARRQAAEKGWRAAREAVYGVIEAHGGERPRGTIGAGEVGAFEAKRLGRPRGRPGGQPLASDYARAEQTLHGECFYDGVCPDDDTLHGELQQVGGLIEQAEADAAAARPRRRGRRGRR
jgi:hypothetical protein